MKIVITDVQAKQETGYGIRIYFYFKATYGNFHYDGVISHIFYGTVTDYELDYIFEMITSDVWYRYQAWKRKQEESKVLLEKFPKIAQLLGTEVPPAYWLKRKLEE